MFTGARRLYSCIQSEQVSLVCDVPDDLENPADLMGVSFELPNPSFDISRGRHDFVNTGRHGVDRLGTATGQFGIVRNGVHHSL